MVDTVGERGYAETTVANVIAAAGASRRTYYAHFPDRQTCLLSAGEGIATRWLQRTGSAVEEALGRGEDPVHAFVAALFELALASPAELRVLTAELGALKRGGERRALLLMDLGHTLQQALESDTDCRGGREGEENPWSRLVPQAMVGAMIRILYARALHGARVRRPRRTRLAPLIPGIARWAVSYRSGRVPRPTSALLGPPPVGGRAPGTLSLSVGASLRHALPRGDGIPSRSFVVHSQRERMLDAIANLSASKGYQAVTIPEIVHEAGVSVQSFYQQFAGREDTLQVAYEVGRRKMLALGERMIVCEAEQDWRPTAHAAIATLLGFLASEPSFAHLAFVDVPAAGGKLAACAHDGPLAAAELLKPALARSPSPAMSQIAVEASASAMHELCYARVAGGGARGLASMADLAAFIALQPFAATSRSR
jgi:AcrR family transcriptional regulator